MTATERQTPPRGRSDLTVRQKILLAAVELDGGATAPFTAEALVARAWKLHPESFSLFGVDPSLPDSNRVLAKLSGKDGLCGFGWLEHIDQRMYRVTRKGREVALRLLSLLVEADRAARVATPPPVAPPRATMPPLPRRRRCGAKPATMDTGASPGVATPGTLDSCMVARETDEVLARYVAGEIAPEVAAVVIISKSEALRKFLRGSPLTFADACGFWGINQSRPSGVLEKLASTELLLMRAVESFGAEGPGDPGLPPLSTCFGLLNLHRMMSSRFSRELGAVTP